MSAPDHSFIHYSPYIRLTKKDQQFTVWIVTYIPDNYTIPEEPTVTASGSDTQVSVYVESGGEKESNTWMPVSFKVPLTTPTTSGTNLTVTTFLDDPDPEGSTVIPFEDAEEE